MHSISSTTLGNLVDSHHGFSAVVGAYPQLLPLETALRTARITCETEFSAAMNSVYAATASLPPHLEIVAACHLGRIAADAWEATR